MTLEDAWRLLFLPPKCAIARVFAGRTRRATWPLIAALSVLACGRVPIFAAEPVNLALNKPASSSSIENDEHDAAKANDGDAETRWSADDEPEGGPEWWQVDLEKPFDLSGCQIRWPFDGKRYRYKVEGSTDGKHWSLLSDQSKTTSTSQLHDLKFEHARQVRRVKITVTELDEGCWAGISEVKVFGIQHSEGTSR
ncbi:MAG TPA: discoidin domain-containing protein [Pirellulales bacterium]|nr:discoidin domain-containing protein [Pirellulales bacterium]